MDKVSFVNTYKDVYISVSAKNQLEDLVSSCNQGNLAFYSDIKVSLNRIAGGEYEGVKFIGNNTWRKDLEFCGGSYYLNLICDYTYRKEAFYVIKFEFNPQTTNRKLSLEEKNKHNTISITESEIRDIVLESVSKILSESQLLNESYTTRRLGKYTIVNGDNEPHSIEGLETYDNNLYDVAMYDTNDETICVFSVGKNSNKFIYCRLEYSKEYGQWLGFTPLKYYDAPYLIRQEIKENFTNS